MDDIDLRDKFENILKSIDMPQYEDVGHMGWNNYEFNKDFSDGETTANYKLKMQIPEGFIVNAGDCDNTTGPVSECNIKIFRSNRPNDYLNIKVPYVRSGVGGQVILPVGTSLIHLKSQRAWQINRDTFFLYGKYDDCMDCTDLSTKEEKTVDAYSLFSKEYFPVTVTIHLENMSTTHNKDSFHSLRYLQDMILAIVEAPL